MKNRILVNWFTSLTGSVAGLPQLIEGITTGNWLLILSGLGTLLLGLSAKDFNEK